MSGSALDRLFGNSDTKQKPSRTPTLEEQLLEDDEENEALFLEGMSESSRSSLMAKVAEVTGKTDKVSKPTIEKVVFDEEPVEEVAPEISNEVDEIEENMPIEEDILKIEDTFEDENNLDIERPAEKTATVEEIEAIKSTQKDDVVDELVQPTKSKRGRKSKVKQDQVEEEIMEKQVSTTPTSVGTIMQVLGVTMLQDLLKSDYTFREFGKEDTALIIKSILSKLEKGD